ncbi:hypothetical protein BDA99DRAFT_562683 [Phascolomyces articulosus]|uniref:RING-type domain-containing protein n=1 Tax=Phascolomyces articulosus TaxID=60185 RepID=A0AAD5PCV7_9FUNG|nr:hypothetical protein BDA99DRAFT_562683 [Phascolomyces articulosus]
MTVSYALIEQAEIMELGNGILLDSIKQSKRNLQKNERRLRRLKQRVENESKSNEQLTRKISEMEKKDLKPKCCIICNQENIEYALTPCFHRLYCKTCAEKLTECAICKTPKYEIQKVYSS